MLQYAVVFALVAIIAGLFGFTGWIGALAAIGQVLCVIFSALTAWAICLAVMRRRPRP